MLKDNVPPNAAGPTSAITRIRTALSNVAAVICGRRNTVKRLTAIRNEAMNNQPNAAV